MKLNYKRTIFVGFAFFLISLFWQAYDATIALTLTNKFGMNQTWSGVVMALDNILALFLLPLFGTLSDKHNGKSGRRTPFIRFGTAVAAVALVALSFVDNMQLDLIKDISTVDDPAALSVIYDTQSEKELQTPNGTKFILKDQFSKDEFLAVRSTDDVKDVTNRDETKTPYTSYVVPARQAYAADCTAANPMPLIIFVIVLLVLLVAMGIFRSPAVALMPDVTLKPLRSKANAIINLMGNAGGIIVLLLGMGFAFGISKAGNAMMSYTPYYLVIAGTMVAALIIFLCTVREKEWAAQMQSDAIRYGVDEKDEAADGTNKKLSKGQMFSLICILLSVALWYFGYNAVTSKYAVYAGNILNMDYNTTLLLAQAAAIVAYLPAGMIASKVGRIQKTAEHVAALDCFCSLAEVAVRGGYCMPEVDLSRNLHIVGGRHPVVEKAQSNVLFVPNDTLLNDGTDRVAIVTGPNMAGKSTYMRQTAIITLMAQMGSFVPAKSATIGVVDRVFTRIGASDDLAAGQSTFMVEMSEMANILRYATNKSLLILDEIGRGTSTYDGMAIARAVLEHCADQRKLGAKTMFATHYHELSALEGSLPGVRNYNITAKKQGGKLIFLRKIVPGAADDSYGIEVAKLAGVPDSVIAKAKTYLRELEKAGAAPIVEKAAADDQISLMDMGADEVRDALRRLDPNNMTPLEALMALSELKKKVEL